MTNPSDIETRVMKRIKRARVLRVLFSNMVLAGVLATAAFWDIGKEVWVSKVLSNGPHDLLGHIQYLVYAFLHTRPSVEVLTLLALAATLVLARETARLFSGFLIPARRHI